MDQLTSIDELTPALKAEQAKEALDFRYKLYHRVQSLMPTKLWLRPSDKEDARSILWGLQYELKEEQVNALLRNSKFLHPHCEEEYLRRLQYYAFHILRGYGGLGIYYYEDILDDAYKRLGEVLLREFIPYVNEWYLWNRKNGGDAAITEDLRCCRDLLLLGRLKICITRMVRLCSNLAQSVGSIYQ